MTVVVVRHAHAGKRSRWSDDDRLRPLSERGQRQAEELGRTLASYRPAAVYSSPYLRCAQTVDPLARGLGLPIQERDALSEDAGFDQFLALIRRCDHDAVMTTHGNHVQTLLGWLTDHRVALPQPVDPLAKGASWIVTLTDGVPVAAEMLPAP